MLFSDTSLKPPFKNLSKVDLEVRKSSNLFSFFKLKFNIVSVTLSNMFIQIVIL